jgi:hypothetical protein
MDGIPCWTPTVHPQEQYARGFNGPSSILVPRAYGPLNPEDRCLVDSMRTNSGQYKMVVAVDETIGIPIPEESPLHDNDTDQSYQNTMTSIGLDVSRAVAGAGTFISPYVQQCFLPAMRAISMPNVACLADFVLNSEEVGMTFKKNPKKHVIFTPLMVNGHQLSKVNSRLETEIFLNYNTGQRCYNTNFWKAQLDQKKTVGGGNFFTLDVGMYIPLWCIPKERREEHLRVMKFCQEQGPMLFNSTQVNLLTLKNAYCHVFLGQMESPLVGAAILNGWRPLWMLKNCFLQKTEYGIRGYQFSTLDKSPKSFMTLIGFFKGSEENHDLKIITLENHNHQFLAIRGY